MENKKIPYLCGGTLFFLLVQAKKPRAKAREREKGVKDGLKDPAMMDGLLRAITGNSGYAYADSLKKNTSQFRECRIDGSVYIPFNDPATASAYDYEVKNSYVTVLSRMSRFSEEFVNPAKASWTRMQASAMKLISIFRVTARSFQRLTFCLKCTLNFSRSLWASSTTF